MFSPIRDAGHVLYICQPAFFFKKKKKATGNDQRAEPGSILGVHF